MTGLAAMRAAQQSDIKAFQQLLERRVANMETMREMQQADANTMASLESLVHQARGALTETPHSPPEVQPASAQVPQNGGTVQQAAAQVPQNLATELESLNHDIQALNRAVKTLADRQAARERGDEQ